jgi:hypothetical protein
VKARFGGLFLLKIIIKTVDIVVVLFDLVLNVLNRTARIVKSYVVYSPNVLSMIYRPTESCLNITEKPNL